jgi:hypothetical protein
MARVPLLDACVDLIIDFVECTFERGAGAVQTGNWGSQVGAQKAAVGPTEEEGGTEAEFWYAVAKRMGQAFDKTMKAQAAQ